MLFMFIAGGKGSSDDELDSDDDLLIGYKVK